MPVAILEKEVHKYAWPELSGPPENSLRVPLMPKKGERIKMPRGLTCRLATNPPATVWPRIMEAISAFGLSNLYVYANAMPESVKDRPTESHEYILMLTKSAHYYWDQEAVRESYTQPLNRWGGSEIRTSSHKYIELGGHDGKQHYGATSMFRKGRPVRPIETGCNLRSVWVFPTQPYPEAHFATFPEKLPEICIKAATPEVGCCSKCGKPWTRVIDHKNMEIKRSDWGNKAGNRTASSGTMLRLPQTTTIGWQPQCKCNAGTAPSLVLDPFAGSGTAFYVAKKLGRMAVGYELSKEYCELAIERLRQMVLPLETKL
jgi:hypothetical protein